MGWPRQARAAGPLMASMRSPEQSFGRGDRRAQEEIQCRDGWSMQQRRTPRTPSRIQVAHPTACA